MRSPVRKGGKDAVFAVAGDHLVHGEGYGFEAGETADLHDDGGLRGVDAGGARADQRGEVIPDAGFGGVEEDGYGGDAEEAAEQDGGEHGTDEAAWAGGLGGDLRHTRLDGGTAVHP